MSEYLDSYCSKCRKKYDVGVVDCFFPYESDNNKCLECFKAEYQDIKADNIKLQAQLTQEREKVKKYAEAMDKIYNHNEACRYAVIEHFGIHHPLGLGYEE